MIAPLDAGYLSHFERPVAIRRTDYMGPMTQIVTSRRRQRHLSRSTSHSNKTHCTGSVRKLENAQRVRGYGDGLATGAPVARRQTASRRSSTHSSSHSAGTDQQVCSPYFWDMVSGAVLPGAPANPQ